jgi:putative tricarboxylic transport membrane protein
MNQEHQAPAAKGPSHRSVEIGVALFTAAFGALIIAGSLRAGINWGVEGPRAGFFPFYIGVFIVVSSLINLVQVYTHERRDKLFAEWGQLRQVLSVVVPTTVYVFAIPYIGIYVASALLIAVFMKWLGRYRWALTLAVAIGVPVIFFLMFEKWFLIPLPKGPIEDFFF